MLFGNVVPGSFQTNSCIGLTLRPQHRGTLSASWLDILLMLA